MNNNALSEKKQRIFESKSIPGAVFSLAFPTVLSQIVIILYNFADTWFVGRTQNPDAVAALSVALPICIIMNGFANLFGIGGASVIARCLGKKDFPGAKCAFGLCLTGGLITSIIYSAVIFFCRNSILPIIGTDEASFDYTSSYLFWTVVVGSIPTIMSSLMSHLIRSVGNSRMSALGMSLGAVLNIALDPLFMFVLLPKGNEVAGAAIATMLSNVLSLAFYIVILIKIKDPVLNFNFKDTRFDGKILYDVIMTGIPAATSTILAMVSNIFANSLISNLGTDAVAGLGVAKKANTIAFNINLGLTQGVLPLIAYNYAAKNFQRMKKVIFFTGGIAFVFSVCCTIAYRFFSKTLISFFIDESSTIAYGSKFLNIIAFAVPICALTFAINTVFQASGKKISSFILSILRKGLFDIPLMYALSKAIGYSGVLWATPTAEIMSVGIAFFLLFRFLKETEKQTHSK